MSWIAQLAMSIKEVRTIYSECHCPSEDEQYGPQLDVAVDDVEQAYRNVELNSIEGSLKDYQVELDDDETVSLAELLIEAKDLIDNYEPWEEQDDDKYLN